jgi:hypothetical protein
MSCTGPVRVLKSSSDMPGIDQVYFQRMIDRYNREYPFDINDPDQLRKDAVYLKLFIGLAMFGEKSISQLPDSFFDQLK